MAITSYNPTTPGRRGMTNQDFSVITTKKPVRSLLVTKKRGSGRNNQGRITTRHKGGGARKFYRLVNFALPAGTVATVEHIEYDPNRSAHIARIKDHDNTYHYVLAPNGLVIGQQIASGEAVPIEVGNRLPIKNIPVGSVIHAIELTPGRGAQIARAAGIRAQLAAKEGDYAQIRMPSGEIRMVHVTCMATIGAVGNEQHQNVKIGKAGRSRHLGKRPTVRGIVMNAVDHPHGGGDGGAHGIGRNPVSPWGQPTLGYKTRRRKTGAKFIVKSRHAAKRK